MNRPRPSPLAPPDAVAASSLQHARAETGSADVSARHHTTGPHGRSTDSDGRATHGWINRLPDWVPDSVRNRLTGRRVLVLCLLLGLLLASAWNAGEAYVEVCIMIGIPLYLIVRIGRKRLKSIGLPAATLTKRPGRQDLLRLGIAASRSLPRFGRGFYGLVATLTFLGYQIRELSGANWLNVQAWNDTVVRASADPFAFLVSDVAMMLWDVVFPISETWITGLVYAAIWPLLLLDWGGFWALGSVLAIGVVYSRLMPKIWPVISGRAATQNARIPSSSSDRNSGTNSGSSVDA